MRPGIVALVLAALLSPTATAVQAAQSSMHSRAQVLAAAKDVIQAARYSTLVTIGEGGQPQARIVDPFVPEEDFSIWIATNPLTRKVTEIRQDPRVTLLYFNSAASEYVTVIGTATLVADSSEKARRWKAEWSAFYKDGPHGDGYLLIRVRPKCLEVVSPRHGLANDATTWRPVLLDMP